MASVFEFGEMATELNRAGTSSQDQLTLSLLLTRSQKMIHGTPLDVFIFTRLTKQARCLPSLDIANAVQIGEVASVRRSGVISVPLATSIRYNGPPAEQTIRASRE